MLLFRIRSLSQSQFSAVLILILLFVWSTKTRLPIKHEWNASNLMSGFKIHSFLNETYVTWKWHLRSSRTKDLTTEGSRIKLDRQPTDKKKKRKEIMSLSDQLTYLTLKKSTEIKVFYGPDRRRVQCFWFDSQLLLTARWSVLDPNTKPPNCSWWGGRHLCCHLCMNLCLCAWVNARHCKVLCSAVGVKAL